MLCCEHMYTGYFFPELKYIKNFPKDWLCSLPSKIRNVMLSRIPEFISQARWNVFFVWIHQMMIVSGRQYQCGKPMSKTLRQWQRLASAINSEFWIDLIYKSIVVYHASMLLIDWPNPQPSLFFAIAFTTLCLTDWVVVVLVGLHRMPWH